MPKLKLGLIIALAAFFVPSGEVFAQSVSSGVAISASVADTQAQDGDIVCSEADNFILCNTPYDKAMFGVITENPAASIETQNLANSHLVLSTGKTEVRVSGANGAIAVGDLVTTSEVAGVGQKATDNGYVLGVALEAYEPAQSADVGKILVSLNIKPQLNLTTAGANLIETLKQGLEAPFLDPLSALRYLSASLMIIAAFVIGFIYFGRVAKAGVEAIGRNPLAGGRIQASVVFHIVLTIAIAGIGVAIAYFILVL